MQTDRAERGVDLTFRESLRVPVRPEVNMQEKLVNFLINYHPPSSQGLYLVATYLHGWEHLAVSLFVLFVDTSSR